MVIQNPIRFGCFQDDIFASGHDYLKFRIEFRNKTGPGNVLFLTVSIL